MNVISLRLLSLFIAVIYHIIIIIVKIMFVLATRTTEVGTCVSLNHIDHNHLVLYTLSGKRNHHHTLQHVSLDGKYAHIYCKYCILKKNWLLQSTAWCSISVEILFIASYTPNSIRSILSETWCVTMSLTFWELINIRNLVRDQVFWFATWSPGLRQERGCKTCFAAWSLKSCDQK